jgi:hypothetical protein
MMCAALPADAASVRDRMRPTDVPSTSVSESQAIDLTLTTTRATAQPIQMWVRTAGTLGAAGKVLSAELNPREGAFVQVGQRARAFQIASRSSMYQARITHVSAREGRILVEATLTAIGPNNDAPFILEIVVDRGRFLAVPNAAIIEEGDARIVYVQQHPGHYVPMEIHTGVQGELYTQVLDGLDEGAEVVTFGSFFIDAEYKLKSASDSGAASGNEHHHH